MKSNGSSYDPDLEYLNNLLKNKQVDNSLVKSSFDGIMRPQKYIIQWDEIVQSFETGYLYMMGLISSVNEESACHKYLDMNIMSKITYWGLNERLEFDVFDYVRMMHEKAKRPIDSKHMIDIKMEVEDNLYKDTSGLIFNVSPMLIGLNAFVNIYADATASEMIFVVPEKYCNNNLESPFTFLKNFFVKNKDYPIYVDTYKGEFIDYLKKEYRDLTGFIKDTVIVTHDVNFITETAKNKAIKNISMLFPEMNRKKLDHHVPIILHELNPLCEYVVYKNKPLTL